MFTTCSGGMRSRPRGASETLNHRLRRDPRCARPLLLMLLAAQDSGLGEHGPARVRLIQEGRQGPPRG